MAAIQLKNIHKSFGTFDVIKGVDLEISPGEFMVFVGPSGCGKSTLLRLIAGPGGHHLGHDRLRRTRWSTAWRPPSVASPWCSSPMRSIRI